MQPTVSSCKWLVPRDKTNIQKVWYIRKPWCIKKTMVHHIYYVGLLLIMEKNVSRGTRIGRRPCVHTS